MDAIKQAIEALEAFEYYIDGGISRYPTEAQVEAALAALREVQPLRVGDYVNGAGILASDMPHAVVQKLQAAIDAAMKNKP
jgi:hypothetical protein